MPILDGHFKRRNSEFLIRASPSTGTMNFVHRNPLVCTSMGLAINRQLVAGTVTLFFNIHIEHLNLTISIAGIVNNPMTGHMYTAIKGRGAFLNGTSKLSVSVRRINSYLNTRFKYKIVIFLGCRSTEGRDGAVRASSRRE